MSSHADTIRQFFLDRYGTDSYNVDQRTLAAIPGSHRRNPPRPNTSPGRALASLDALLAENQRLSEALRETGELLLDASEGWSEGNMYERGARQALALAGDAE